MTPQPLFVSGAISPMCVGDAGHVRPRLLERRAGLQASDHLHVVLVPLFGTAFRHENSVHMSLGKRI